MVKKNDGILPWLTFVNIAYWVIIIVFVFQSVVLDWAFIRHIFKYAEWGIAPLVIVEILLALYMLVNFQLDRAAVAGASIWVRKRTAIPF